MQHLLEAIHKIAIPQTPSRFQRELQQFVDLLSTYLKTGDDSTKNALLQLARERHYSVVQHLTPIAQAISHPSSWTVSDRRLVEVFSQMSPQLTSGGPYPTSGLTLSNEALRIIWDNALAEKLLEAVMKHELPGEDCFSSWKNQLSMAGISPENIQKFTAAHLSLVNSTNELSSAGRFFASRPASELAVHLLTIYYYSQCRGNAFISALAKQNPDITENAARFLIGQKQLDALRADFLQETFWEALLDANPSRFQELAVEVFDEIPHAGQRFALGLALIRHFPNQYEDLVWHTEKWANITKHFVFGLKHCEKWKMEKLKEAIDKRDPKARSMAIAGMQSDPTSEPMLQTASWASNHWFRHQCAESLIGLQNSVDDPAIEAFLLEGLSHNNPKFVIKTIPLCLQWNLEKTSPKLWGLLEHKSKPVREATVPALAKLGEAAVPQATSLLSSRKTSTRIAATKLLGIIGTNTARQSLITALETEKSEKVADTIRAYLP